ncbi:MAG: helix-turn-helix domain-containing protein [Clostridia bacterium]|nr:helix-turn-helix domain-containing protein [Clostridia bacterium]
MNLGEKINELRKKNSMTQEMVADAIGVTAQAVSKWERGVTNPDLYLIPALAELFGVTADELFGLPSKAEGLGANEKLEQRVLYLERLVGMLMAGDADEALEYSLSEARPLLRFDFTKMSEDERESWSISNGTDIDTDGKIRFRSTPKERVVGKSIDPQIVNESLELDLTGINRICIRMRTFSNHRSEGLQIFFKTKEHPTWDEQKSIRFGYQTVQTVNLNIHVSHPYWYGTLTGLRIDTTANYSDRSEVGMISLIDYNGVVRYICEFDVNNPEIKNWKLVNAIDLNSSNSIAFRTEWLDRKKAVFDPYLENNNVNFEIGRSKHVHIRMRTDPIDPNLRGWNSNNKFYNAYLQVYFKTESSDVYNEQKRVRYDYVAGAGMVDLYVDMSKNGFWNGKLTGLRLDPTELIDARYEIELIEILEPTSNARSASLLKDIQDRLESVELIVDCLQDAEDRIDDLESQIEDLESRIDELE